MNEFIVPLTDEIFFIKGERNGKLPYSNSILFKDYLVDTGVSRKNIRKLKKKFNISSVCFSHWHEDHCRDSFLLKDAEFFCHTLDKEVIENSKKFADYYAIENTPSESLFKKYLYEVLKIQDTCINQILKDGEILEVHESIVEASRQTGINRDTISKKTKDGKQYKNKNSKYNGCTFQLDTGGCDA